MTKVATLSFEDYMVEANKAETKDQLFKVYSKAVNQHGLDRVLLCLATDHKDIGETAGMNFMYNYPADWMQYYFEKGFDKIDPIMIYSLQKYSSFYWNTAAEAITLNREQKKCLNLGTEAGLNNGICTPLRGPKNSIAGLSLASSEKKDAFDGNLDVITAYSNHFYIAYRRLGENKSKDEEIKNISLTTSEKEVLKWAALGKRDPEIADIIGISTNTVKFHKKKIFEKLDANDTTYAVVKAITYGLIHI